MTLQSLCFSVLACSEERRRIRTVQDHRPDGQEHCDCQSNLKHGRDRYMNSTHQYRQRDSHTHVHYNGLSSNWYLHDDSSSICYWWFVTLALLIEMTVLMRSRCNDEHPYQYHQNHLGRNGHSYSKGCYYTTIPRLHTPRFASSDHCYRLQVRPPGTGGSRYRTRCIDGPDGKPTFTPQLYPTEALCGALYQVIPTTKKTLTASVIATVTGNPPPPPSLTTTTVSLTIPIDASTTTTILSTFTNIGTSLSFTVTTASITSTQTVDESQPTVYAACEQDNLLTSASGETIVGFGSSNALSRIRDVSNPYDCCVACITSPDCATGVLFRDEATCYLVAQTGMTCDPKVEVLRVFTKPCTPNGNSLSTGYCGVVTNGGSI